MSFSKKKGFLSKSFGSEHTTAYVLLHQTAGQKRPLKSLGVLLHALHRPTDANALYPHVKYTFTVNTGPSCGYKKSRKDESCSGRFYSQLEKNNTKRTGL